MAILSQFLQIETEQSKRKSSFTHGLPELKGRVTTMIHSSTQTIFIPLVCSDFFRVHGLQILY